MGIKNIFLLLVATLFVSCTKTTVEERPVDGQLTLRAAWEAQTTPPPGLRFYFYRTGDVPLDVRMSEQLIRDTDAKGFIGILPVGTYQALAVNSDVAGVNFTNMSTYQTATVEIKPETTLSALHSFGTEPLVVDGIRTIERSYVPTLLTKTLILNFEQDEAIASLSGVLCGTYPSVLLDTGTPSKASQDAAPTTTLPFEAILTEGKGKAILTMLGILGPEYGVKYHNLLQLKVVTHTGETLTKDIDMNRVLSDMLKANGGVMPSLPVEIDLKVNIDILIGLQASVVAWSTGGEGEGNVYF